MKACLLILVLGFCTLVQAVPCLVCGPSDEGPQTLAAHRCLGMCLGTKRVKEPSVTYNGLLLGLVHTSMDRDDVVRVFVEERCDVNGASVEVLAQVNVGAVRGVAVTGLLADVSEVRGVQLSGLANRADAVAGFQAGLALNRADGVVRGVQAGVVNVAGELKGLQIGLLNVNHAGWTLPLLNISW